jgi:hypothetical protein
MTGKPAGVAAEGGYLSWEAIAGALLDCAEQCAGVLRSFPSSPDLRGDENIKRAILLSAASMQAAATSQILAGEPPVAALRLVIRYARQARHALAGRGQEHALRLCADCCHRTELMCRSVVSAVDEID